jgi:hypothetical protein
VSKRALIIAAFVSALAITPGVWAYFTATGTGSGTASTGTLTAPGQPTRSGTGSTVDLTWTAASVDGGGTIRYHVERSGDPVTTWSDACGTTASSGTTSTSCTDSPSAGTYRYRVTAIYRTWTAVSAVSDAVVVTSGDTTPPYVLSIDRASSSPTNATSVGWTVTFSESVTGVDAIDFALARTGGLTGGSVTGVSGSGSVYTVSATTGAGDGTLGLNLVDNNSIQDGAGNPLGTSGGVGDGSFTGQVYTVDKNGPTVTVEQKAGQADPTNALPIRFTVHFSESVSDFSSGDVTLGGTATGGSATVTGSGQDYEIDVSGLASNGTVTASITAGSVHDALGNAGSASTSADNTVTYDPVGPTVTINQASGQSDPTGTSPIDFTVVFSESVSGFATGDVTLSGTAGASTATVTGSGTTYNVAVSGMTTSGTVIATVGAAKATDAAGNANAASTSTDNTVAYDTTPFVQSINRAASSPTNAGSVSWTVTFTRPVTGVDTSDFALAASGVSGASIAGVTGSGATYTVTASSGTGNGTLGLNLVDDNTIRDAANNGSKLGGNSMGDGNFTGEVYAIDKTPPTVTVNQKSGQADPTNALPILFTVTFSEPVSGFDATDLTRGGTAAGGNVAVTGSGASYEIAVTNPGSNLTNGTLVFSIGASKAQDAAGNNNAASTSTDNTVTYDNVAPTVTINQAASQSDPTNAPPINFTVVFSESVTGFVGSDVTLGGTAGATTATVTGSGTTYNVAVSGMTSSGTVTASVVAAAASDAAGNTSAASTSSDNTVAYDNVAPTVTINQAAGQSDPTNVSPINFTVVFSKSVTGFATGDVTLAGTAGATTATVTGSGTTYNVAVTGMTTAGTVIATVGANKATDSAGNGNVASTSTDNTVTYDATPPAVTVNQKAGQADPTNALPILFTVTFSEPVTGFDATDLTRGGTATGGAVSVTGSGAGYEIAVTDPGATLTDGTLTFTIAAGRAQDAAGNTNAASTSSDNSVTYDKTAPALVSLVMQDIDADGKVDTVVATFNETLASSTATAPWTLTNVPSGGTLSSVSTSGTQATLTLTEGSAAASTAVGNFKVALAASATGIRDAVGNQSSFAATAPSDGAGPVPTVLTDTNGTTEGKFEQNDTMTVTFSEPVTGVAAFSTLTLTKGSGSNNDTVAMTNLLTGTVSLGEQGYITGSGSRQAIFANSALTQPTTSQVRVTLGACSSGDCASVNTVSAAANFIFAPVATLTDAAGNAAAGSITVSIKLF